ncbi:MAG: hypothetical protein IJA20_02925 [Methanocorpusculum sp.]|nr:hypothetical protein [Oscillospiraceae bacterium]MBQ3569609.1 hypothetical protein [Methanocorpusculum sp.]
MDIKELEEIMVEHGVVLRAIPMKVTGIYEVRHRKQFPNARVEYLEDFKREMLIDERVPINAGKFIFESNQGTGNMVKFYANRFYDSIEDAMDGLLKNTKGDRR